ncbi:CLUMA_CG016805, isoform A [Clunio marinus]|uniref:CLUMA_CG016805, isoform A n=1 Tax=Clunio marinus TaxID=568069 RepID=A0A1J1ISV7_9DIPT|nr:CLUMA_CG016805, isoform A [Clunio marinus]
MIKRKKTENSIYNYPSSIQEEDFISSDSTTRLFITNQQKSNKIIFESQNIFSTFKFCIEISNFNC